MYLFIDNFISQYLQNMEDDCHSVANTSDCSGLTSERNIETDLQIQHYPEQKDQLNENPSCVTTKGVELENMKKKRGPRCELKPQELVLHIIKSLHKEPMMYGKYAELLVRRKICTEIEVEHCFLELIKFLSIKRSNLCVHPSPIINDAWLTLLLIPSLYHYINLNLRPKRNIYHSQIIDYEVQNTFTAKLQYNRFLDIYGKAYNMAPPPRFWTPPFELLKNEETNCISSELTTKSASATPTSSSNLTKSLLAGESTDNLHDFKFEGKAEMAT